MNTNRGNNRTDKEREEGRKEATAATRPEEADEEEEVEAK